MDNVQHDSFDGCDEVAYLQQDGTIEENDEGDSFDDDGADIDEDDLETFVDAVDEEVIKVDFKSPSNWPFIWSRSLV